MQKNTPVPRLNKVIYCQEKGDCMSKINILLVITFVSRKIETCPQIRELHVQNDPSFCNNFCQQEDRDVRPVSINRSVQCTTFTTFHFTPTGRKMICMSKINLLFIITFASRKIET